MGVWTRLGAVASIARARAEAEYHDEMSLMSATGLPQPHPHLVGVGIATIPIRYELHPRERVTIGRDVACSIVLGGFAVADDAVAWVSLIHAVVEEDVDGGWCIYDNESTNGTSLLKGGRLPTISLAPGERYPLHDGDVVELAGAEELRLVFLADPRS